VTVDVAHLAAEHLGETELPALEKILQCLLSKMLLIAHLDKKLSLELIISRLTPRHPGAQQAILR
jgi:hypothetical protein